MKKNWISPLIALTMALTSSLLAETANCEWIKNYLVYYKDFPKEGINFVSHAPLLFEPAAFEKAIKTFAKRYQDYDVDVIAGLDSRGFIFGAALALEMKVPFVMIRKPGKLPGPVERIDYSLEYGKNTFELETGLIPQGSRVLIVDDLLATGGTAQAASTLIERIGSEVVEVACVIELPRLEGRKRVSYPVFSLIAID